jgi:hypothetical protein
MVKKVNMSKKQKESINDGKNKKNKNLTGLFKQTKQKIIKKINDDIGNINTTILFKINLSNQSEYEKEYQKRYSYYLKEEFNSNIITMFFNYISISKVIPVSFKNNRYFIKEFLKIITDLLINEIDFATISLIFDYLGWIKEGEDPWLYIYFICLCGKKISSSDGSYNTLLKILDSNNKGFIDRFKKWSNNSHNEKKFKQIDIIKTNQKYRELMKHRNVFENNQKFINYNELVNKIVSTASKQKENKPQISQLNNTNISPYKSIFNQQNQQVIMSQSLDITPTPSGIKYNNNKLEFRIPQNQSFFDLPQNNSFNFNLSRGSSKNSLADFRFSNMDLNKSPSFRFYK